MFATRREGAACVQLRGRLYLCGGLDLSHWHEISWTIMNYWTEELNWFWTHGLLESGMYWFTFHRWQSPLEAFLGRTTLARLVTVNRSNHIEAGWSKHLVPMFAPIGGILWLHTRTLAVPTWRLCSIALQSWKDVHKSRCIFCPGIYACKGSILNRQYHYSSGCKDFSKIHQEIVSVWDCWGWIFRQLRRPTYST